MKFNMNVFCILFLVLINTIGNQGDPNHRLPWGNTIPPYIVSLRNATNGHMCTGSVIAINWVLSSLKCNMTVYFVYGLRAFKNNLYGQEGEYATCALKKMYSNYSILFKLKKPVESNFKKLRLPILINSEPPKTGKVIGWVFDTEKELMVMKYFAVNLEEAFFGTFWGLSELGVGPPLIANGFIYGYLEDCKLPFVNVQDELNWINNTMRNN